MKKNSSKPEWQDVVPTNDTVKYYSQRWESFVIKDDILYYKSESDYGRDFIFKQDVPKELKPLC